MNTRDRSVIAVLVLLLVVFGVAIAIPNAPAVGPVETSEPSPSPTLPPQAVYREGVVGVPTSITPVTARTRSERTLVGLVFSGLVKLGPGNTYLPDLAESWTVDKKGKAWTFKIRDDAVWQDGEPVTSADVVYTVQALQSPDAMGVGASAWADVTVEAPDERTVVFKLGTPVAGFIAAALQPLLPEHLLADVPFADLATSEFAALPTGSGPYAISEIDETQAVLVPATSVLPGQEEPPAGSASALAPSPSPSPSASPSAPAAPSAPSASASGPSASVNPSGSATASASASPVPTPAISTPPLERISIRFFEDEASLTRALEAGDIDASAGLSKNAADRMTALRGMRRLRYPTTTLSTILLNLRSTHPELRDPKTRQALLMAIDRNTLVANTLGGDAVRADALVPPESWAYKAASPKQVRYDVTKAKKLLDSVGWATRKNGKIMAPKAKEPYTIDLVTPPADANPRSAAVAAFVKDAWTGLGMTVNVIEVPVAELGARLREGDFGAAVIDIAEGLEPDLYPLLASTQVLAGGSNLAGFQDSALDTLLEAARKPGTGPDREKAWKALLEALALKQPLLPLAWIDEVMVARGLEGAQPRLIRTTGDRFWDVLAWRLAADR